MNKGLMHPTRIVPAGFLLAIALGTVTLMLPIATRSGESAGFLTALFTATSAICVTGLITVDTPTFWSPFGQVAIMLMIKIGGLGIMTAATLLGLAAGRRLSLSDRAVALTEHGHLNRAEAISLVKLVFVVSIAIEAIVALALWLRWWLGYGMAAGEAAWHGLFHAISAFNNAGFSTFSANLIDWQADAAILLPIMAAIVIGGIGFPVLHEVWARRNPDRRRRPWSLHSRLTLATTVVLLVMGTLLVLVAEWANPKTLGAMPFGTALLNAAFHSVSMRTAGFNAVDIAAFADPTLSINYVFMLIGGGSAGTAGGLKVTTFALLGFVVWSEVRGHAETTMFGRRVGSAVVRQALSIVLIAIGLIGMVTLIIDWIEPAIDFRYILFETISAFATVGLSAGITAQLSTPSQLLLVLLMFVGRVGTITFVTALALAPRSVHYRYPQEQPIVG
ncbi:potassium transporter TrkG [Novosphingobium sp.]|jgi:trk system potassium uptake protein TrkH|uniref:TrkH family potassium uptake protein n=1 Tax=Novosphingobium sp. TaxID=1874826 RepID=UPI0022C39F30|nr:potassium transporter TrkG [Novosphingobium sp.]MCZ8017722.1 TrkH family potassium uptake protein [Novosphingobium sp.]MCZ8033754.1 TrkH family potassium uptake protein [Novosphingobium sp.]MCZ8051110.1 TrkH family potassium uptake protein [Novosphingobium sp.]MCZ8059456.1 TrkH family potassium uptake protein [Novosphingobium sp.]MCZ8231294.1 TrkH family potassium uptake protein [Novosphingobium sp.]